jgi:hypothetical protein
MEAEVSAQGDTSLKWWWTGRGDGKRKILMEHG